MTNKEIILEGLKPMFEEAEAKGLWFHCCYQDMWFTPSELKEWQNRGKFVWGAVNWTLRNPQEKVDLLEKKVLDIGNEINNVVKRANG